MTILITGGTGRVGNKLAQLLDASGHAVLIASRSGSPSSSSPIAKLPFIKFDWLDSSTFENPFKADTRVESVVLVAPFEAWKLEIVKPFIDLAVSKGVKRFLVVSASAVKQGHLPHGVVHQYLVDIGVDYVVLKPTWFIDNFRDSFAKSIKYNNDVVTTTRDGRIPFVGTDDIAKVAYDALVAEKSQNAEYYIVGPKLYTYDEAVAILSQVVGRTITHRRLTREEGIALLTSFGLAPDYAAFLVGLEEEAADGAEEKLFNNKNLTVIVGKQDLKEYFEVNKEIWAP